MKKIVLILLAILPACAFAQTKPDNFTLTCKIGALTTPAKVFLGYRNGGKDVIDSTLIVNGACSFHGYLNGPVSATMVIDAKGVGLNKLPRGSEVKNFYLEKGNISLTTPDSLYKATITGSKVNDDEKRLTAILAPSNTAKMAVLKEADTASDAIKISPDFQNYIQRKYTEVLKQEEAVMRKFIADNPQSFMSLAVVGTLDNRSGADPFEIERLFNMLSPEIKATEAGVTLRDAIAIAKTTAVGAQAPDFMQSDTSGNPVTLSSFKGKYVLIDFWASWCGPCRQENPNVVKAYNLYKNKNFTILGVSLDREGERAAWVKAIKDDGLPWTQVSDLKYWANSAAILYKISSIPQNYLIDPTGKIIAKGLRGTDLDAKLAEVLK